MNAPNMVQSEWTVANQDLLVAEFSRLKARLRGEEESAASVGLELARSRLKVPAAIDNLVSHFALTPFERDILLLAAGVEMDSELAALCGGATSNVPGAGLSFSLVISLLAEPHWSALVPTGPLRFWRLLELGGEGSLVTCRLRIDERILHYLAGISYLDQRLQAYMREVREPAVIGEGQGTRAKEIAALVKSCASKLPVLQLWGMDDDGKCDVAASVAAQLGLQIYVASGDSLPCAAEDLETISQLWQREAVLFNAALFIDCQGVVPSLPLRRFAARAGGLTMLAVQEPVKLEVEYIGFRIDKPVAEDRCKLWRQNLGEKAGQYTHVLQDVAAEFRLSAREIRRACSLLAVNESDHLISAEEQLRQVCLAGQSTCLGGLAQRIEPRAHWDNLILPKTQKAILQQIVVHLRHRFKVYQDWGFAGQSSRGLGIAALFAGESGTGKSMAAEVLANELRRELFRIDLSAVVSKYIGETEKNLAQVFDAAEEHGCILFFDEADALFGKRSEVRDSHDRYANIEVSFLLQRMEAYDGLAILTTNQKTALDPAFHRRLRFVVNFPFPQSGEREAIWRNMFPPSTPIEGLDYAKLSRLQITGGNIRNIALSAAFLAAEAGTPVTMQHILQSAQAEAGKRERPLSEAETRGWG